MFMRVCIKTRKSVAKLPITNYNQSKSPNSPRLTIMLNFNNDDEQNIIIE